MEENKVIEQDVETKRQQKSRKWTKLIARVGNFGAISALFYIIPVPTINFPIFPWQFGFLIFILMKSALIAGFAYVPVAGSLVY